MNAKQSIDDFLREYTVVFMPDKEKPNETYYSMDTQRKILYMYNCKTQEQRHLLTLDAYAQYGGK